MILDTLAELQKLWLSEVHRKNLPTKMIAFKFLSIPFWIKNGFQFRCVQDIEQQERDWNIMYKISKLLILMNQSQDLHQYIDKIVLFSLDPQMINQILKSWVVAYYNKTYNENFWIKNKMLDGVGSRCIEDCESSIEGFCSNVIYKNICCQISQESLTDNGIMALL